MSSGNTNAYNKTLSQLDAVQFPQLQQSFGGFQAQNANAVNNVQSLLNPSQYASMDAGLSQGIDTQQQEANQLFQQGGYSPEEISGMKTATAAGFAAPFKSASDASTLAARRTGQSAGVASTNAQLARQRGQMISAGLGGLEQNIGTTRIGAQQQALSLSQLPQQARLQRMQQEGTNVGQLTGLAGQQLSAYGTAQSGMLQNAATRSGYSAQNPSALRTIGSGLAAGLGNIGATVGGTSVHG